MHSLVVGMGIGGLYKTVLEQQGGTVVTVDQNELTQPVHTCIEDALTPGVKYGTAHICTPNYMHEAHAGMVADKARIVFVEKPGVKTADAWCSLYKQHPNTRFMMVKNNMWRQEIALLRQLAAKSKRIELSWIRRDCVPNPGSWFTTRSMSYGGVSRDLMPHLLSLYIALEPEWHSTFPDEISIAQRWQLADITTTGYGTVKQDGTYDVDDRCKLQFGSKWAITADWRSMGDDRFDIVFHLNDGTLQTVDLGWCPEDAYSRMIADATSNLGSDEFWLAQQQQDVWIHELLDFVSK